MTLREQMQKDVGRVFFREDHFAEEHNLNGMLIPMIIEYFTITGKALSSIEGVFNYNCTIHFAKKYSKELPKRGSRIKLDGNEFVIEMVAHNMGVVTLMLQGDDSV